MHVRSPTAISRSYRWIIAAALLFSAGCRRSDAGTAPAPANLKSSGGLHAAIETEKGTIEVELLAKDAPKTVENFRLLAERGYYNGIKFHRIVRGFMIQGGDPKGTGEGGESAWGGTFPDEIERKSDLYRGGYRRGMLAMANSGPDTNGSQFFIMHQDYPLQPNYTIFGKVVKGMDVVDTIAVTETAMGMDGNRSRPLTPQVIKKVTILP